MKWIRENLYTLILMSPFVVMMIAIVVGVIYSCIAKDTDTSTGEF
jgi:hypothetical protein